MSRRIRYAQPIYNLPYGREQTPKETPLPNYPATGTLPQMERTRALKMVAEHRPETISNLKNVHPVLDPYVNSNIGAALFQTNEQSMRNLFYPDDGYYPKPTKQTLNSLEKIICKKRVDIHPSNAYKIFEMLTREFFKERFHGEPSPFKEQLLTIIKCLASYPNPRIRSSSSGNTVLHFLADEISIPIELRQELAREFITDDLLQTVNNEQLTPLDFSILNFDSDFARFLIQNGATASDHTLELIVSAIYNNYYISPQLFQSKLRTILDLVVSPNMNIGARFEVFRDGDTIEGNIINHITFLGEYLRNRIIESRFTLALPNLEQNIAFALESFRERMGPGQEGGKRNKTRKSKRTKRSKRVKTHRRR